MNIIEIIDKKKDKKALQKSEIDFFVDALMSSKVSNEQVSAFLMAITINGMTFTETYNLTMALSNSGSQIDLGSLKTEVVDKHSTGGVSDSTTLVVAPIVAACGVKMAKMSGGSLGFTGGTADKLQVFTGYDLNQSKQKFIQIVDRHGASIISQTRNFVPADKKLYKIRSVTGTDKSINLIAASIMSKKLASGADIILLDVKFGEGALIKTAAKATKLAKMMVEIGKKEDKKVVAILTNMNQPLGSGVGLNLEVKDAIAALKGERSNLATLSKTIAEKILSLTTGYNLKTARQAVNDSIVSGNALLKFQEIIRAHGGDDQIIARNELITKAKVIKPVTADKEGYIYKIHTAKLGQIANELCKVETNKKNFANGLFVDVNLNKKVKVGDPICHIHASSASEAVMYEKEIRQAFEIKTSKAKKTKLVYSTIR